MDIILSAIIHQIVSLKKTQAPVVLAICGAADLGKSYLSAAISMALQQRGLQSTHITLDSYLISRLQRKKQDISGYQINAYHLQEALDDLVTLIHGQAIYLHPYDHTLGSKSNSPILLNPTDYIILDGLHSMHPCFIPHISMSIFVHTHDEQLKIWRQESDIEKRNYTKEYSNSIMKSEFDAYKKQVAPYKNKAQYLLYVPSKWTYEFGLNEHVHP